MKIIGVYGLFNCRTGRVYVGASRDVRHRVSRHFAGNTSLSRQVNPRLLMFALLERLTIDVSREELWKREQFWLDRFPKKYNIYPAKGSAKGHPQTFFGPHTKATRKRMSEARKGHPVTEETREKLRRYVRTNEHREKISSAKMGHDVSEEARRKISAGLKRHYQFVKAKEIKKEVEE